MKKILCLFLSLAMLAALLSACTNPQGAEGQTTKGPTGTTGSATQESSAAEEKEPAWKFTKYEPAITLSVASDMTADVKFAEGDSVENSPFTRWAEKELGIKFDIKWVAPAGTEAFTQKMNLALASNDIPDVCTVSSSEILRFAKAEAIIPVDGLIDEYASPLFKYLIDEYQSQLNGTLFMPLTHEGKAYGIPQVSDIWSKIYKNTWIRKDILDELGKGVPETLEQYEQVLAAYHEKYPNGVGLAVNKDLQGLDPVLQAYNAFPDTWLENEKGELVYGAVQPEVKKALEVIAKWYKNGWIDPEFIAKPQAKILEDISAGNVLSLHNFWHMIHNPFPNLVKNVPAANMVPVKPLKGPDGTAHILFGNPINRATYISENCKYPEALIHLTNRALDSTYRGDQNLRDKMKNEYGYEFEYPFETRKDPLNKDEKDLTKQVFDYQVEGPMEFFNQHTSNKHSFTILNFTQRSTELVDLWMSMIENEKNPEKMLNNARLNYEALIAKGTADFHLANFRLWKELKETDLFQFQKYMGPTPPTSIEKGAYLSKLQKETFARIIMGASIDEFDKFVEDWYKGGGEQITAEVNEWYKSSKK